MTDPDQKWLDQLWNYSHPGAIVRYLQQGIDQLRCQRLQPMQKLAHMLLTHPQGILNYCKHKVPSGVVETINENIKALLRRGRGYRDINYLLLKAQRLTFTKAGINCFSEGRLKCILRQCLAERQLFSQRCPMVQAGRTSHCNLKRDGKPDLLFASHNAVAIMLGNGDGTFQPATFYRGSG
jgi:hypothetical protein